MSEDESEEETSVNSDTSSGDLQKEMRENGYVQWLIEDLKEEPRIPWVNTSYGTFDLETIDNERLLEKFQTIVDMYNAINIYNLELEIKTNTMNVNGKDVVSIDVCAKKELIEEFHIDQLVHVKPGAVYWESAYNYGSGKYGTIEEKNPYISIDMIVTIDRVAYLDKKGNILSTSNTSEKSIFNGCKMLHISSHLSDLGWIDATDLTPLESFFK